MSLFVTFPGNANDTWVFGGAPHDLKNALCENGTKTDCLDLTPGWGHSIRRYAWNLKEALLLRGIGGYQYSDSYLNDIWRRELRRVQSGVVINLFPMFHESLFARRDLKKVFYMDQTNIQLFENYHMTKYVSAYHRAASIAKEKRHYQSADLILCMCHWAAHSMISDYDIPAKRIAVVHPGGSIDYRTIPKNAKEHLEEPLREFGRSRPLRFVFVGLDPVRKGLFRFLDALKTMPDRQDSIRLTVVGPLLDCPTQYRDLPCVRWLGRIDRKIFVNTVAAHDLGILLSTAEATGRSLREFQMLGLGVLAPNVGGSPEMLAPGAGVLVEKDDGPREIASIIRTLLGSPETVAKMRQAAWNARQEMTWEATAQNVLQELRYRNIL